MIGRRYGTVHRAARRPCEAGIGLFCDERGSTTVASAVAILVSLALVFSLANVQWASSHAADVQVVADAGALAGANVVAAYVTIAQILDALVLSMGLIGLITMAVGLVLSAIPVVDAAVWKLVRLSGGPIVRCGDPAAERALSDFLRRVPAGRGQYGIGAFLDGYLDCLLTCGRAVGEIVPTRDGRDIAAVLCGDVERIEVRDGRTPLETELAVREEDGRLRVLPRQDLLLFTPYHPSPTEPYGVSLLHSLPFLAEILLITALEIIPPAVIHTIITDSIRILSLCPPVTASMRYLDITLLPSPITVPKIPENM